MKDHDKALQGLAVIATFASICGVALFISKRGKNNSETSATSYVPHPPFLPRPKVMGKYEGCEVQKNNEKAIPCIVVVLQEGDFVFESPCSYYLGWYDKNQDAGSWDFKGKREAGVFQAIFTTYHIVQYDQSPTETYRFFHNDWTEDSFCIRKSLKINEKNINVVCNVRKRKDFPKTESILTLEDYENCYVLEILNADQDLLQSQNVSKDFRNKLQENNLQQQLDVGTLEPVSDSGAGVFPLCEV